MSSLTIRARAMIPLAGLAMLASAIGTPKTAGATAAAKPDETIVYGHQPGGLCPGYSFKGCTPFTITLDAGGRGVVAATDDRGRHEWPFQATEAERRAFRDRLQPYRRPNDIRLTNSPACRSVVTDGDTIDVTWRRGDRVTDHVALNGGCLFPGKDKMFAALASAPSLLPVGDHIGPH